jgi:hypothetical protein
VKTVPDAAVPAPEVVVVTAVDRLGNESPPMVLRHAATPPTRAATTGVAPRAQKPSR